MASRCTVWSSKATNPKHWPNKFFLEGASCFPLLLFYIIFPFSNSSGVALTMIGLRNCGATLANLSSYYWKPECATLADIKPVGLHNWKVTWATHSTDRKQGLHNRDNVKQVLTGERTRNANKKVERRNGPASTLSAIQTKWIDQHL